MKITFLKRFLFVLGLFHFSFFSAFAQTATSPSPVAHPVVQKVKESATNETVKPESSKSESSKALDRIKNSDTNFFSSLDYPELQVVPRASDRLAMESPLEKDLGLAMFWPFQLSGLATIATGFMMKGRLKEEATEQERKDADFAANAAVGIGAAWIGLTYYLLSTEPYGSELAKIRKYKGTDKRTDLLRERIAEEALQKPAELIRTLTWMSFITNFGVTANLIDRSTKDNNLYPALGALASFLPFIFKNRYIENYEKHLEYKRKIYAPIVSTSLFRDSGNYTPGLLLTWNY
ncbi:MAG: hypothetical protein AABY64_03895 [Bdellovibrionota bacterium]